MTVVEEVLELLDTAVLSTLHCFNWTPLRAVVCPTKLSLAFPPILGELRVPLLHTILLVLPFDLLEVVGPLPFAMLVKTLHIDYLGVSGIRWSGMSRVFTVKLIAVGSFWPWIVALVLLPQIAARPRWGSLAHFFYARQRLDTGLWPVCAVGLFKASHGGDSWCWLAFRGPLESSLGLAWSSSVVLRTLRNQQLRYLDRKHFSSISRRASFGEADFT